MDDLEAFPSLMRGRMLAAFDDAEFQAVCRGLSTRVLLQGVGAGVVIAIQDVMARLEATGAADISIIAAEDVWPPCRHQVIDRSRHYSS